MSSGFVVDVDQPSVTVDISDVAAIVTAGNFVGISLDTLNAQGPAGQGAFQHVHTQGSASSVWTIDHGLGGYPNVTVVDDTGGLLWPTVEYVTVDRVTVTHSKAYAGTAYLS